MSWLFTRGTIPEPSTAVTGSTRTPTGHGDIKAQRANPSSLQYHPLPYPAAAPWEIGEKGATAASLLLPESTFGKCLSGEAQINVIFPESFKETSPLRQLLCSLKVSSATWALWAPEPGARPGLCLVRHSLGGHLSHPSSWGSIHTAACPEDCVPPLANLSYSQYSGAGRPRRTEESDFTISPALVLR